MADYAIGVDLGGTNLRAAAIDGRGEMLEKTSITTDLSSGPEVVVVDIVEAIKKLKVNHASDTLVGVGKDANNYRGTGPGGGHSQAASVQFFVDGVSVLTVDAASSDYWVFKGFVADLKTCARALAKTA